MHYILVVSNSCVCVGDNVVCINTTCVSHGDLLFSVQTLKELAHSASVVSGMPLVLMRVDDETVSFFVKNTFNETKLL